MSKKLLPYPFCGSEAEIIRHGTHRVSMQVACTNCGCQLETNEIYIVNPQWNTRAPSQAEAEMRDALEILIAIADGYTVPNGAFQSLENSKAILAKYPKGGEE